MRLHQLEKWSGWAYQFYISKRKDEVFAGFKKKRKAETVAEVGPATQLFTPEWIVRYMVENSLGRLWMLNNPDSALRERMEYYIEPEGECEDFIRIASPEDLRVLDPACGSGHILVYAFDLLAAMYEERGYRPVDAAQLILEKNLVGFEIDERAAQLASFALVMKGCELAGRRFLRKGVRTHVRLLSSVVFDEGELAEIPAVAERSRLVDALAHLSECGSLFVPEEGDVEALEAALAGVGEGSLFADALCRKLESAIRSCRALEQRFDVVAGNPPYMGSSNFGAWLSKWTKKNYPDTKSDLFAASYERTCRYVKPSGEVGLMTPYVWMFIGSYEKMRLDITRNRTITSLVQLEYSGFAGATVPICTFTFVNQLVEGHKGGYVRLADFPGAAVQGPKTLEAIHNPDCGYFYRADASTFSDIPGTPIAYWASKAMHDAFKNDTPLSEVASQIMRICTGDNNKFLRYWFEVSASKLFVPNKWIPYSKGGTYKKWLGNEELVINFKNDGEEIKKAKGSQLGNANALFKSGITWSAISSSRPSFRHCCEDRICDQKGPLMRSDKSIESQLLLSFLNSSVAESIFEITSPTLDFIWGSISKIPVYGFSGIHSNEVGLLTSPNIEISRKEWNLRETSMDFRKLRLVS